MATGLIQQSNMNFFKDNASSSSNLSLYTSEAHNRISTGDFIYQPNDISKNVNKKHGLTKLTDKELSEQPLTDLKNIQIDENNNRNFKKNKQKKEFPVIRKNSYHGPNYFRLSKKIDTVSPSSRQNLKKTQDKKRLSSKYENDTQIEPVFDLFPESSLLEKPSYMVQYFTKTFDLIKKNPDIHYKILKAKIQIDTPKDNESLKKLSKKRKYQSLPVMGRSNTKNDLINLRNDNRRSAPPVVISYRPTSMTITEYLNTPLDFYQHKKNNSQASSSNKSKETRVTHSSSTTQQTAIESKTGSSDSNFDSVATSILYANRSKLMDPNKKTSSQKSILLKTHKKDNILQRRSAPSTHIISTSGLKRDPSLIKKEKYLSKYGTTLVDSNITQPIIEEGNTRVKRKSDCGDLSIATGNEMYNDIKNEIFSKRFTDWTSAIKYIIVNKPELSENSYFLNRLMFEIYLRRVIAARIAFKLGSDKTNKGDVDDIWIGLKECIASVYGEDNATFFESQNKK